MRRCIIHFGMHKTGSSSIQQSLFCQTDGLAGVHYLHAGSANSSAAIATAFGDQPHKYHANRKRGLTIAEVEAIGQRVKTRLSTQLTNAPGPLFLLSAEEISTMGAVALTRLIDWLHDFVEEVEAVGYVRPPAAFMASSFQQQVKGGSGSWCLPNLFPPYRERFEAFDRILGSNRVRFWKFDPLTFPGGCVVRDFCARLGIPEPESGIVRVNERLSREAVSLLYAYRKYGPGYGVGPTAIPENRRLIAALSQLPGQALRFAASAAQPVLVDGREQIDWMEERLGTSLTETLSEAIDAIQDEEDLLRFSPEAIRWLADRLDMDTSTDDLASGTPELIARWMHDLRLKLARDDAQAKPKRLGRGTLLIPHRSRAAHSSVVQPNLQPEKEQEAKLNAQDMALGRSARSTRRPFILGSIKEVHDSLRLTTDALVEIVSDNTGNLVFCHAIELHCGKNLVSLPWDSDSARINEQEGYAVLPCANQLGPHVDLGPRADRFRHIERPMIALGLGAQSSSLEVIPDIPEGSIRWVKEIIAHAPSAHPNITVRGRFTQRILELHGLGDYSVALGCPSLFINPARDLGRRIARRRGKIRRIAVTAGNFGWASLVDLERSLTRLVTETEGGYVVQNPLPMLKIARNEYSSLSQPLLASIKEYLCPDLSLEEFVRWTRRYACCFSNVPDWMSYLRDFDFVIGTRIHGVMLALQAEVPALCIAHDSRTLELCEIMRIPHIHASEVVAGVAREDLERLFDFNPHAFDANRAELAGQYVEFLRNNHLEPGERLSNLESLGGMRNMHATSAQSNQEEALPDVQKSSMTKQLIKPTLHIHIGNGKTGTTAIQKALSDNVEALRERGLLYLGICFDNLRRKRFPWNVAGGSNQLFDLSDAELAEQVMACLEDAILESSQESTDQLVWSNEWLFIRHGRIAQAIEHISDQCHLHIIVYLRRQDRWLVSAYKQWGIKHKTYPGSVLPFREWYEQRFNQDELDYAAILEQWRQALPQARFSVRVYDRYPDVCVDFFNLLGVPYPDLPVQVGRFYETPNNWLLSYYGLFNHLSPEPVHPKELMPLLQRTGLSQLKAPGPIHFDLPDEAFLRDLLNQCQSSNEQLAERFSTSNDVVTFDDAPAVAPEPMLLAEPAALIAGLLRMVQFLDRDVCDLRRQLARLGREVSSLVPPAPAIEPSDGTVGRARRPRRIRMAIGIRTDRVLSEALPVAQETELGEGVDVFWIADETSGKLDLPRFPKLGRCLEDYAAMKLPVSGPRPLWYYGDYPLYSFRQDAPGYDYYLMLESDTWVKADFFQRLSTILREIDVDFVGCQFSLRSSEWHWWKNGQACFDPVYGSLFPLLLLSAKAIERLMAVRLEQTATFQADALGVFCESFVPSALMQAGFVCMDLNRLIPNAWTPETFGPSKPIWCQEIPHLAADQWVMHPVLGGADYAAEALAWSKRNHKGTDITLGLTRSLFGTPLPESLRSE